MHCGIELWFISQRMCFANCIWVLTFLVFSLDMFSKVILTHWFETTLNTSVKNITVVEIILFSKTLFVFSFVMTLFAAIFVTLIFNFICLLDSVADLFWKCTTGYSYMKHLQCLRSPLRNNEYSHWGHLCSTFHVQIGHEVLDDFFVLLYNYIYCSYN